MEFFRDVIRAYLTQRGAPEVAALFTNADATSA